ncbi:MAG: hypothetical protein P1Q69_00245 [Candidatus Thorarchaeota archaeon]|nr:hypothetical protein [Candidatus Thorarchaeota archaeon]
MRVLEIVLIIILFILSVQFILPPAMKKIEKRLVMGWIGVTGYIVAVLHVLLEGARWQMLPIYIPIMVLFVYELYQLKEMYISRVEVVPESPIKVPRKKLGAAIVILGILLVSTSFALDYFLPVFQLPEPSGDYSVGTTSFDLTDTGREETFTEIASDNRKILIQCWYPIDDTTGLSPVPYIESPTEFGQAVQNSFGFPSFIVSHFPLIPTQSYRDAPLSDALDQFPVLIFSHGYGGFVFENTVLMQELASHGYIVFSISHTYESASTVFTDGSVAYEATEEMYANISNSLLIWADDTRFLIDELETIANDNIPSMFWTHLDFITIGVLGHSFGGTTAEELCVMDTRISAGMSFDSPHIGNSLEINMTIPFMMIFGPDYGNPEMNDTIYNRAENTCYGLFVNGTRHYNFADATIWSPVLKSVGLLGSIDGYRMLDIMNKYVLAFFDQELRGIESTLLDGPSVDYPEIMFYYNNL